MAGTDRTKQDTVAAANSGPAVILVAPQLGENVGTAARAMLNFGLTDLRLVKARDGWPNAWAEKASSGALQEGVRVRLFDRTEDAIADLERVYATTARDRDLIKPVMTPQTAIAESRGLEASGARVGLLVGYEYFRQTQEAEPLIPAATEDDLAPGDELIGFYEHLERELDSHGFLYPPEKRPAMVRNIRAIFQRAGLTLQEVRTLRGIVASLVRTSNGRKPL